MTPLVPLWSGTETNNQFIYYVTGGVGLVYLVALLFAFVSRRSKSSIIVLSTVEKFEDERDLHKYVLTIDTSCNLGSSLSKRASLRIQLIGTINHSKVYKLHAVQGGRLLLQRGNKDIFVFKTKDHLGDVLKVKLIVSGDYISKWIPVKTRVVRLATGNQWLVPIEVTCISTKDHDDIKALTYSYSTVLNYCGMIVQHFLTYHTWFSPLVVDIRFGAYTNTVNLIVLFFSTCLLFVGSLMVYIITPQDITELFYLQGQQLINSLYVAISLGSAVGLLKLTLYQCRSGSKKKVRRYQQWCLRHEMVTETVSKPKISLQDLTSKPGKYVQKHETVTSDQSTDSGEFLSVVDHQSWISGRAEMTNIKRSVTEFKEKRSPDADKTENAGGEKKDARNINQRTEDKEKNDSFSKYHNQDGRQQCRKSRGSAISGSRNTSYQKYIHQTLSQQFGELKEDSAGIGVNQTGMHSFFSINNEPPVVTESLSSNFWPAMSESEHSNIRPEIERSRKETVAMKSENLLNSCQKITFDLLLLLREAKVDIMEGRLYNCVKRTEDKVLDICSHLEKVQKKQADCKSNVLSSSSEGSQFFYVPEEVTKNKENPLLFWRGSIHILNHLLCSVPQSYSWRFKEHFTELLVNKAADLVISFDESQFQQVLDQSLSDCHREDEEVIIDDYLSVSVDETMESIDIRKSMALVLQISINQAFMEMFGEMMVVSLPYLQDSISTDNMEDLIQTLFDDRAIQIHAVEHLCRRVIEQAINELVEDYQNPVCVYAQFMIRQTMLRVLSHIKHTTMSEGKGQILGELINGLRKKWHKEGFHQSHSVDKDLAQLLLSKHLKLLMDQEVPEHNKLYEFLQNITAVKRLETELCRELQGLALTCIGVLGRGDGQVVKLTFKDLVPADRGDIDAMEYINAKCSVFGAGEEACIATFIASACSLLRTGQETDIGIISMQTYLPHLACCVVNREAILLGASILCNDAVNSALLELQVDLQTLQYARSGGSVSLQDTEVDILRKDFNSLHAYLHIMKAVEQMKQVHSIKNTFIKKNEKKHKEFAIFNLQNVLDSYNTVDADSFDKSLTNKMLFELEWDFTNENKKPLPHFLKGMLGLLMVCGTVVCLWYTGQTGGQLSITEVQEWAACYLITLLCYGLVVDSVFAMLIGCSQLKYKKV